MKSFFTYLLARLGEASTWRGLIVLATGLGVHLEPMAIESIVSFGLSAAGLVGVFFKDKTKQSDTVVKQ